MKAGNLPFPDLQGMAVRKFSFMAVRKFGKQTYYQSLSLSYPSVNDVVNLLLRVDKNL